MRNVTPPLTLVAEPDATLSSGSLRLYAMLRSPLDPPGYAPSPVGCIDLYAYDPLNRRCAVGIMVATAHRRHGMALAMLQALEKLYGGQLHQLYADIAATNAASIALFAKAGYRQCGLFRDWLADDDRYIDSVRMQKTIL